jgi:oligopeptide transport system substrate-binding protein
MALNRFLQALPLARAAALAAATALVTLTTLPASAQVIFHRGNDSDPETLDSHKTSVVSEAHLLRDLSESLVIHNMKGEVVPGVAESWTITNDGTTYTFKLRANAKWSNGEPVTAQDLEWSYRRLFDPETGAKYANLLFAIKNAEKINKKQDGAKLEDLGVKAIDARTLQITLERPTPYFLELLTHQTSAPVSRAAVAKHGKDFVKPENWIGNGAYTLKEVVPNSHILLVKNPHFHDAANVQIDQVKYYPSPELAAAARRFQAGELHFTTDIPADQTKFLKERLGSQVSIAPYLGTYYVALNTAKKPFDDVRVRQALSMAIDREFIADQVWSGTMVPAYGFLPPGLANYGKSSEAPYKAMSPIEREDKAKELLKAAGFGPGKPLKVELRYNLTDNNKNTVVAIAEQWKQIGVETSFINTDAKTHFAHLRNGGDFDAARAGWIADHGDPQNFLFLSLSDNTGFNYAKYNNPEFDRLMKASDNETDLAKRAEILRKLDDILVRDVPNIPVLFYSTKNLVSPKLKGFQPNNRGAFPTRFMRIEG